MKVIIEKADIEKILQDKYPKAEILDWDKETLEITLKVDVDAIGVNQAPARVPAPQVPSPDVIRTDDGTIDANKTGLTNKNREVTRPGGAMGKQRGRLPVF